MVKDIETYWNKMSEYYQKSSNMHTKSAHYGPLAPDEDKLKLIGNVKGKKILEVGCGGGQCSVAFAKQGAICSGIDISKEQLKYAELLAKKNKVKINFIHGTYQKLDKFKSANFDIVFSAFAFQYCPNISKLFKQIYRILKKNGIFVFSLNHPFYDTLDVKTFKVRRSYYDTGRYSMTEKWSDGSKVKFVMYKRKISDIFNALVESKFKVEKMIEPLDKKQKAWAKQKDWEEIYPRKLVNLMGPTIIFKAKK